jgi:eukaryotic-like serine/threonine-protein kinase
MPLLAALVLALTPGIRTPSGNIACFVSHGTLRCQIAQAAYRPQLQRQCLTRASLDWHGFELSRTEGGRPSCSGGILTGPPSYRTLAYGSSRNAGDVTCTSRITGLTCTIGGHGLFISRASWRGW